MALHTRSLTTTTAPAKVQEPKVRPSRTIPAPPSWPGPSRPSPSSSAPDLLLPQPKRRAVKAVNRAKQMRSKLSQDALVQEAAEEPADAEPTPSPVLVNFRVPYRCSFGQTLALLGDHEALGSWKLEGRLLLAWTKGDEWNVTVPLPPGCTVQYKFLVVDDKGGVCRWQDGTNVVFTVPMAHEGRGVGYVQVQDSWCRTTQKTEVVTHHELAAASIKQALRPPPPPDHVVHARAVDAVAMSFQSQFEAMNKLSTVASSSSGSSSSSVKSSASASSSSSSSAVRKSAQQSAAFSSSSSSQVGSSGGVVTAMAAASLSRSSLPAVACAAAATSSSSSSSPHGGARTHSAAAAGSPRGAKQQGGRVAVRGANGKQHKWRTGVVRANGGGSGAFSWEDLNDSLYADDDHVMPPAWLQEELAASVPLAMSPLSADDFITFFGLPEQQEQQDGAPGAPAAAAAASVGLAPDSLLHSGATDLPAASGGSSSAGDDDSITAHVESWGAAGGWEFVVDGGAPATARHAMNNILSTSSSLNFGSSSSNSSSSSGGGSSSWLAGHDLAMPMSLTPDYSVPGLGEIDPSLLQFDDVIADADSLSSRLDALLSGRIGHAGPIAGLGAGAPRPAAAAPAAPAADAGETAPPPAASAPPPSAPAHLKARLRALDEGFAARRSSLGPMPLPLVLAPGAAPPAEASGEHLARHEQRRVFATLQDSVFEWCQLQQRGSGAAAAASDMAMIDMDRRIAQLASKLYSNRRSLLGSAEEQILRQLPDA